MHDASSWRDKVPPGEGTEWPSAYGSDTGLHIASVVAFFLRIDLCNSKNRRVDVDAARRHGAIPPGADASRAVSFSQASSPAAGKKHAGFILLIRMVIAGRGKPRPATGRL